MTVAGEATHHAHRNKVRSNVRLDVYGATYCRPGRRVEKARRRIIATNDTSGSGRAGGAGAGRCCFYLFRSDRPKCPTHPPDPVLSPDTSFPCVSTFFCAGNLWITLFVPDFCDPLAFPSLFRGSGEEGGGANKVVETGNEKRETRNKKYRILGRPENDGGGFHFRSRAGTLSLRSTRAHSVLVTW